MSTIPLAGRLALPLLLVALLALAATAPSPDPVGERPLAPADTEWAWPENPENLEALPEDIPPEGLRAVMRSFTRALDVRCHHCHVGEEGQDFLEWDFASDEKPEKEIAREMMRMTRQINLELLPAIEGLHGFEDGPRPDPADWLVTCWTCHRGEVHPEHLAPPLDDGPPSPERSEAHDHDEDHDH
ncbi:MAG: c-type cytochrome, partial [Rubricoccaceae bacterium]|nr:c-type cytochrome [Rubricoccaceae bacterium]